MQLLDLMSHVKIRSIPHRCYTTASLNRLCLIKVNECRSISRESLVKSVSEQQVRLKVTPWIESWRRVFCCLINSIIPSSFSWAFSSSSNNLPLIILVHRFLMLFLCSSLQLRLKFLRLCTYHEYPLGCVKESLERSLFLKLLLCSLVKIRGFTLMMLLDRFCIFLSCRRLFEFLGRGLLFPLAKLFLRYKCVIFPLNSVPRRENRGGLYSLCAAISIVNSSSIRLSSLVICVIHINIIAVLLPFRLNMFWNDCGWLNSDINSS